MAVVGLIHGDLNVLHLNGADNVLHILIAAATLVVGFGPRSAARIAPAPAR